MKELGCVSDSRHDTARCRSPGSDLKRADKQNQCHNQIHHRIDHRIHECKNDERLKLNPDKPLIRLSKPLFLICLTDTGLNDADRRDILLHDRIDLIELSLQFQEQRS